MNTGISIDAGYYHNLIIGCDNNYLTGWGDNRSAQIALPFFTGVKKISAGAFHNSVILSDNTIFDNTYLVPNEQYLDVSAGYGWSMGIKSGTRELIGWGGLYYGQNEFANIPNLTGIKKISAGYNHSLAVLSNSGITGWGGEDFGEIDISTGVKNPISIAAGWGFSLAVTSGGRLTGWGDNTLNQIKVPTGFTGVKKVVAGGMHGLALSNSGKITGWGDNTWGQITIPSILKSNIVEDISAGYGHSIALLSSGNVIGWGLNFDTTTLETLNQGINYTIPCDLSTLVLPIKSTTGSCYTGNLLSGFPCSGLLVYFNSNYGITTGSGNLITGWSDRVYGFNAVPQTTYKSTTGARIRDTEPFYQSVNKSGVYLADRSWFNVDFSGRTLLTGNSERTFVIVGKCIDPSGTAIRGLLGDKNNYGKHFIYKQPYTDKISYSSISEDFSKIWQVDNDQRVGTGYFSIVVYQPTYKEGLINNSGYLRVNGNTQNFNFDGTSHQIDDIVIGARSQDGSSATKSDLISVLVYNRKLSNQEISGIESVYNVPKPVPYQPPCCYNIEFSSSNSRSRFVVLTGDALNWDGAGGLPNYKQLFCDCTSGDKTCPILNQLPLDGITKIFDTDCVLTTQNKITGKIFIENTSLVKFLVIPNCLNEQVTPNWKLNVSQCCDPFFPTPNFSGTPVIGRPPFTVNFTDLSTGNLGGAISSWQWDFTNDGSIDSTVKNPSYSYTSTGDYSVRLIATNSSGSSQIVKTSYINSTLLPIVNFSGNTTNGIVPFSVNFTDLSVGGNITGWRWNFTGGSEVNSTLQNPSFTYTKTGVYTVILNAINQDGNATLLKFNYITGSVSPLPIPNFTGIPLTGYVPLVVNFSDTSTNSTSRKWDFNNNGIIDSTSQNESWTYDTTGDYTVRLVAQNSFGESGITRTNYVKVSPIPIFDFTGIPLTGFAPLLVNFSDLSTNATGWQWNFTGGSIVNDTGKNPSYQYNTTGNYTVKLTVLNSNGSTPIIKTNYISVYSLPTMNFIGTPLTGLVPFTVNFTDLSTNVTGWEWNFTGGSAVMSTEKNPSYQYTNTGIYTVKLTGSNAYGKSSITRTNYISGFSLPIVDFTGSPRTGNPSLTVNFTNLSTNATSYRWNFTGGSDVNSTLKDPSYTYNTTGNYTVRLTSLNAYGLNSVSKTDYISVATLPVVDFSASPLIGAPPLQVNFTNLSTNATGYRWNFSGASTIDSTGVNPSYTYNKIGNYTVTLTGLNIFGSTVTTKTNYISVGDLPTGNFTGIPLTGFVPLTVNFTDTSTNSTGRKWDFTNDGIIDRTGINESWIYNTTGKYTVKLISQNSFGESPITKTDYVLAVSRPTANFTVDTINGYAPLTGNFTNLSTNATGYRWDFNNDGTIDSTIQNPSYIYDSPGLYTVKLTALNQYGDSVIVQSDLISVMPPTIPGVGNPVSNFTGDPLAGYVPLVVNFTNLSTDATGYRWDFNNDGIIDSTGVNPSHSYTSAGNYDVTLTALNSFGSSSRTYSNFVIASDSPPVDPNDVEYQCMDYYKVLFWARTAPSRLVILTGDALLWNGAGGVPDYSRLGCDCISGDKNCPELNNLQDGIGKALDTSCTLRETIPFSGNVYLPKYAPHRVIVIPDCLNQNSNAKWEIQILSGSCDECSGCAVSMPQCNFNFNISFYTESIHSTVSEFNFLTSYNPSISENVLKVNLQNGSPTYYKDIGFIIKNFEYKDTALPGVKWLKDSYIVDQAFLFPNNTNLKLIENDNYIISNTTSWQEDSQNFSKYGLTQYDSGIAGKIIQVSPNKSRNLEYAPSPISSYTLVYNAENLPASTFYKQEIVIKEFEKINTGVDVLYSLTSGWATYDCKSGTNYKNLFSWGVQLVDKITLNNAFLIESGASIVTGLQDVMSKYVNAGMPPVLYTGQRNAFNTINGFCAGNLGCQPPKPLPPAELCWTGNNTYDKEYQNWFSGVLKEFKNSTIPSENSNGENTADFTVKEGSINKTWEILTGYIQYNSMVSGDTFKFRLYPFDYTGLYKKLHLGNNPLYPSYDFDLVYPKDWTTLSGLVNKLNEKLAEPFSYPVWYPYACLSGTPQGIYITGALAKFWKNTGSCCLPTGDLSIFDYQNRIDFEALRSFPVLPNTGDTPQKQQIQWFYDISIDLYKGNRRGLQIYSGYSYMLPNRIELQRYKNNNWETIDTKYSIYEDFTGITPNITEVNPMIVGQDRVINLEWLKNATGAQTKDLEIQQVVNTGQKKTLYEFTQYTTNPAEKGCPVTISQLPVKLVWPEGFPSVQINKTGGLDFVTNAYWCKPIKEDEDKEKCDICTSGSLKVTGCISPNILIYKQNGCCECIDAFKSTAKLSQLRSGWNLTGDIGQNVLTNGDSDKYRVILKDFSGQFIEGYKPVSTFYVSNINLYGLESQPLPILIGEDTCLINSDYSIDIGGFVGKKLTGEYNYTINPSMSGQFDVQSLLVTEFIPTQNKSIKFNKASGNIVDNYYSGVYSELLKPSGYACHTFDDYYFYDSASKEVTLSKTACEYTKISTGISRNFQIIKPSVINKELLIGGRLNSSIQLVYYTGSGYFSNEIKNVVYKEYDVVGYYPLTGKITGYTNNGRLLINKNTTGYAFTTDSLYPYYPIPTGQIQATGYIKINNAVINDFDYITINNNTLIYNTNNTLYTSPAYFNNLNTLNSIINEATGSFLVQSVINQDRILLYSLLSGSDGNQIALFNSSSGIELNNSGLQGGKYIYPKVYNYYYFTGADQIVTGTEITPIFTGNISNEIVATGFYTSPSGSGTIVGNVPTYVGTRTFTGIWGLQSGQDGDYENFLANNWISGINTYYNKAILNNTFNLLQFSVRYDNELLTPDNNIFDVVQLKIKDNNYRLVYPTGNLINNTGEIIFRITGIKNL